LSRNDRQLELGDRSAVSRPCRALHTSRSLDAGRSLWTNRSLRPCDSGDSLGSLQTRGTLWSGSTLRTYRTCGASRSLDAGRSLWTNRSLRPCWTSRTCESGARGALRTRRALRPRRSRCTLRPGRSLWSNSGCALWSGCTLRTYRTCGASWPRGTRGALRPSRSLRPCGALRTNSARGTSRTCESGARRSLRSGISDRPGDSLRSGSSSADAAYRVDSESSVCEGDGRSGSVARESVIKDVADTECREGNVTNEDDIANAFCLGFSDMERVLYPVDEEADCDNNTSVRRCDRSRELATVTARILDDHVAVRQRHRYAVGLAHGIPLRDKIKLASVGERLSCTGHSGKLAKEPLESSRTGRTLHAGRTLRTETTSWTLRTDRSLRTRWSRIALRTLRAYGPSLPRRSDWTLRTDAAGRSLRSGCADRTGWANWTDLTSRPKEWLRRCSRRSHRNVERVDVRQARRLSDLYELQIRDDESRRRSELLPNSREVREYCGAWVCQRRRGRDND
jgi:hypothetical protein